MRLMISVEPTTARELLFYDVLEVCPNIRGYLRGLPLPLGSAVFNGSPMLPSSPVTPHAATCSHAHPRGVAYRDAPVPVQATCYRYWLAPPQSAKRGELVSALPRARAALAPDRR